MATFAGVTFSERGGQNGAFLPVHGAEVATNVITIPGGSLIYVQVGQPHPVSFSLPARCTASQLASLRGKVNTSGTLAYVGGSTTATLEEVSEPQEVKQPNDVYFVVLQFKI